MVDELHTLMNFFPVTSNQQAVATLLDYVEMRLSQRNLHVERIEHQGVYSLYASTRGQKHARVMLQGHVDVVPGGEAFREQGDKIYGRGCYDMLFATASFLKLIDSLDNPNAYDISILLTGDEEIGGPNGIATILGVEQYTCDICILPDAGDGFGTLSVAAKGIFDLQLRVNGTSHHGSRPWEGDGAANKLIAYAHELEQLFDSSSHDNSTFVISQLKAGNEALNQGPAEANLGIDIRFADEQEYKRIRSGLEKLNQKYDVEILTEEVGRSFALDTKSPLVQDFIERYEKVVKKPIEFMKAHGSSDARYFDDKGMPVIMCRPDGGNAHGDSEWISVRSWEKFHQLLEEFTLETARL